MPENTNTGFDWSSLIKMILPLLMSYGGYQIGKKIDETNAENMITPQKAVDIAGQRRTGYQDMLGGVRQGGGISPELQTARTTAQTSLSRPVTPPATFNPYATNPSQGQMNPMLMAQMMQMAMGQNPQNQWGSNILQQSLANRFGTRNMQGTLTPMTIPGG